MASRILLATLLAVAIVLVTVLRIDAPDSDAEVVDSRNAEPKTGLVDEVSPGNADGAPTITRDESTELPASVRWREHPVRSIEHHTGEWPEKYQHYRQLAEQGNGIAAHVLANMVLGCAHVEFETREQLETAVTQMRETYTYFSPTNGQLVTLDAQDNIELLIDIATKSFEQCEGLTLDERRSTVKWYEVSANHGYSLGMLDYANTLSDPIVARDLRWRAWQIGDANGLLAYARDLRDAYDSGAEPDAKFEAFVAMHAFVTLRLARYGGADPDNVVGRINHSYQAELDALAILLFPEDLEAGKKQATDLLRMNPNCCYEF